MTIMSIIVEGSKSNNKDKLLQLKRAFEKNLGTISAVASSEEVKRPVNTITYEIVDLDGGGKGLEATGSRYLPTSVIDKLNTFAAGYFAGAKGSNHAPAAAAPTPKAEKPAKVAATKAPKAEKKEVTPPATM